MIKVSRLALFLLFLFLGQQVGFAQKIDVLTYNIRFASLESKEPHNWNSRRDGVIEILKGHDFIGLQEVLPVQVADIMQKLSGEYGVIFRTRETDPSMGEGSPLLYNKTRWKASRSGSFWLSDTPEVPGSNTWGAAFNRIVTFGFFRDIISGDSLLVINTHFDHISQPAREKSIDLILGKFGDEVDGMPVIFTGDLNVTPDNRVYQKIISGSSLVDSWAQAHKSNLDSGPTFHGWTKDKPVERIDYIFFSPKLSLLQSNVIYTMYQGDYPSDHFPLNSVFSF